ncbi:hypothetical protein WJX84_004544 [Apatococcus fuscideae]|uniref:RHOMBOID-like protein n=2 Tax=Apatococcus fuscideae TaxID=2026836 RepID=A0AAW1T2N0_9CHLO
MGRFNISVDSQAFSLAQMPSAPPVATEGRSSESQPLSGQQHLARTLERVSKRKLLETEPDDVSDLASQDLYQDLLIKANGNHEVASKWLTEMGVQPPFRHSPPESKDLDTAAELAGAPSNFFCPISMHLFRDPVVLPTGQTYERRFIERWLAHGCTRCPCSGQSLVPPVLLMPNVALRKCIEEWADDHATWLLGPNGQLKPIPPEDDILPRRARSKEPISGLAGVGDADLALAIRLQDAEMDPDRARAQQHGFSGQGPATRHVPPTRGRLAMSSNSDDPFVTVLLLLVSLGYAGMFLAAFGRDSWTLADLQVNPLIGPRPEALVAMGARNTAMMVASHQYWRFVTALFLPSGVLQLIIVLPGLWIFGRYLEAVVYAPALSLTAIYLLPGIAGCLASANLAPFYISVGPAASVAALLGGVWADQLVRWRAYRKHGCTIFVLVLASILFLILGFIPFMDNFVHIIAFACGALLTSALLKPRNTRRRLRNGCSYLPLTSITGSLTCPEGGSQTVNSTYTPVGNQLAKLCSETCNAAAPPPGPAFIPPFRTGFG